MNTYTMCVTISTIPSFILALAMKEERDGKHFVTYCKTDQRQKEVWEVCSLTFSGFTCYYCTPPVQLYPLLISILLCTISDSWLSVCQASRAQMLLAEIRNWEEEEAVEGDLS